MKLVLGFLIALFLATIIWGGWFIYDMKQNRLGMGAAQAIAAEPAKVDSPEMQKKIADRFIGNPDSGIDVLVFSSFTCFHCANFHKDIMPKLLDYAKKDKIAVYFKDFALDTRAAAASMLSKCMPESNYWQFLDVVFAGQDKWGMSMDYKDILSGYAALGGMDKNAATECLNDKAMLKAILLKRDTDSKRYNIQGTPTIYISANGKKEQVSTSGQGTVILAKIDEIIKNKEKK